MLKPEEKRKGTGINRHVDSPAENDKRPGPRPCELNRPKEGDAIMGKRVGTGKEGVARRKEG